MLTGDIREMTPAELDEVKKQLADLYTQDGGSNDTEVKVALFQMMAASMNVSSSLSDPAACEVFMEALTLADFKRMENEHRAKDRGAFGAAPAHSVLWALQQAMQQ